MWTNAATDLVLMGALVETHLHLIHVIALRDFSALVAKLTATIALTTPANTVFASTVTTHSIALVTRVTPVSCARNRSMNATVTPVSMAELAKT